MELVYRKEEVRDSARVNMKKSIILLMSLCLCMSFAFADQSYSDWAQKDIQEGIEKGYIPESLQNNYRLNITRAEFCDFIITVIFKSQGYRYFTEYSQVNRDILAFDKNPFDDLNIERQMVIIGAYNLKIINGKSAHKFHPDDLITREEAAKMLVNAYRVLLNNDHYYENNRKSSVYQFKDDDKISVWAKDYVYEALESSLINGIGNNKFDPKGNLTREQAFVIGLRAAKTAESVTQRIQYSLVKEAEYFNEFKGKSYQLADSDIVIKEEDVKVPVITLDSADTGFVNQKIKELYDRVMETFETNLNAAWHNSFTKLGYKYSQNEDVLSVLLYSISGGHKETEYEYMSFNFSLSDPAKILNNSELLKRFSISEDKFKRYMENHIFEKINYYQSFYPMENEAINMSDYVESVSVFYKNLKDQELALYMSDRSNLKNLILFINYIGDPAGSSNISDVIKLSDEGFSELWQAAYDNLRSYRAIRGVLLYMPVGETFAIKDSQGKRLKVVEIDTKVQTPNIDMYFIPLESLKFTLTDISYENNLFIDKNVVVNDMAAEVDTAYKMPINFSKIANKSLKISDINQYDDYTIHYIDKEHDAQFFNVINRGYKSD